MSYDLRKKSSNDSSGSDDILQKINEKIEGKFSLFKSELIAEIKATIIDEVKGIVTEQNKKIVQLESTVSLLQEHVKHLKYDCSKDDDLEQYGRRLCLRINGIEKPENEGHNDVFNLVKEIITESGVDIPECVLDRAHRIGRITTDDSEIKTQPIIVRFGTFRHRTLFYRSRKILKNKSVQLDLTKKRYSILKEARKKVEGNDRVKFVFCRYKLQT